MKRTEAKVRADRKYEIERAKKFSQLKCTIEKPIADKFKEKLAAENKSINEFFKQIVEEYIAE